MASLLTPAIGQRDGAVCFLVKAKGAQLVVENVSCGSSLEECWETQSFRRGLQLFGARNGSKYPESCNSPQLVPDASFAPKALRPLPLAHDITASSLADLGFALWAKGDLARARSLHERALARSTRKYLVPSNLDTAQNLKHLGGLCF
jgi:hypothetical protein